MRGTKTGALVGKVGAVGRVLFASSPAGSISMEVDSSKMDVGNPPTEPSGSSAGEEVPNASVNIDAA